MLVEEEMRLCGRGVLQASIVDPVVYDRILAIGFTTRREVRSVQCEIRPAVSDIDVPNSPSAWVVSDRRAEAGGSSSPLHYSSPGSRTIDRTFSDRPQRGVGL
jgi:hypothetical protein